MKDADYLASVTIGERKPFDERIVLAPYDQDWPEEFVRQAHRIRGSLSDKVLLLEHVGSTSVPGLSAKPVIDMVLSVANSADESAYVPHLEDQGFVLRIREPEWFEHRLLNTPHARGNLHVFSAKCGEIDRMLMFRDWLREHEDDRQVYEDVKRELATRTWKHVQHYADAKSEVVEQILYRARSCGGIP